MYCDDDGQLCPGGVDMNGCYEGDYCAPSYLGKYLISAIFTHFILMRSVKIGEIPCEYTIHAPTFL